MRHGELLSVGPLHHDFSALILGNLVSLELSDVHEGSARDLVRDKEGESHAPGQAEH